MHPSQYHMRAAVAEQPRISTLSRFIVCVPALLLAFASVRFGEWMIAGRTATAQGQVPLPAVLGHESLAVLRWWPLLLLSSWLLLRMRSRHWWWMLGALWSAILLMHAGLSAYSLVTHVPLGADLFGYNWEEIRTTAGDGATGDFPVSRWWLVVPFALLWSMLWGLHRFGGALRRRALPIGALLLAASLVAWLGLVREPSPARWKDEGQRTVLLSKLGYFFEDNVAALTRRSPPPMTAAAAAQMQEGQLDPRYPLLRRENTPNVLGPLFNNTGKPPNFVFVVVEGLGRSFSGPDARLGSFTPFLDSLAQRSVYFENFIAPQGRTFGVITSLFGSLPHVGNGFADLGAAMPPHASLLSVLRDNGYHSRFYLGFDPTFDNERAFFERQKIDAIYGPRDFDARFKPTGYWGYGDGDLVTMLLERERKANHDAPSIVIMQTISMHSDFNFPGRAQWEKQVDARLDAIGISSGERSAYRQQREIYASILYTDDALRRLFESWQSMPDYDNTIFVVTGDHCLPEITLADRIERFHVPMLVFSPLLKAPKQVRAVSSHYDVTPSILSYLAHDHGVRGPSKVAWIGRGLDLGRAFGNQHDIPMLAVKRGEPSLLSGPWFLDSGQLYSLHDRMRIEREDNADVLQKLQQKVAWYADVERRIKGDRMLMPQSDADERVVVDKNASLQSTQAAPPRGFVIAFRSVRLLPSAGGMPPKVEITIANDGDADTPLFVPLLVVVDKQGKELGESYGAALRVAPGTERTLQLALPGEVTAGDHFVAVIPTDPGTAKRIAEGRYHVPIHVQ